MRTLNLDPFWRTSVGYDRLFDLVDQSLRLEPEDNYPPCNIIRTGENAYSISLAVAGFKRADLGDARSRHAHRHWPHGEGGR